MTARLPSVGGDNEVWGTVLNEFLGVGHNSDGSLKSAALLDADNTFTGTKNVFKTQIDFNSGNFSNPGSFDIEFYIAPTTRSNPAVNTVGQYLQWRMSGNLGGFAHDAHLVEFRGSGLSNTGTGQNAIETSLVITGGSNTINKMSALIANFHTEGTPTGTVDEVSLLRVSQVPSHGIPLATGFTIDKVYGIYIDDQISGTSENYSVYAPTGKSVFGPIVPKDSTSQALVARAHPSAADTQEVFVVQNSTPTTGFRVLGNHTAGVGGIVFGCSFWINNNNASASTPALRIQGHPSQSGNLLEFRESGGTNHIVVTAATSSLRASLVMAASALATNATDGFFYASSMAGAPSGTPTANTGTVPIVIDTTNSKLMAYIGGAWKGITLT